MTLMVGHLLEYHPAVAKMKELIDSGELGKVYLRLLQPPEPGQGAAPTRTPSGASARTTSRCSTSSPATSPKRSAPRGECYLQDDVEDVVFGYIKYKSGVVGHLHVSWLDPHKSRKITVVGEKKMVVFDDMESERKITVYDKGATTTRTKFETYGEFVTLHFGDIHIPKIGNDEPLRHRVPALRRLHPRAASSRVSDGRDALNVVKVLDAMEVSLREGGRPVTGPPTSRSAVYADGPARPPTGPQPAARRQRQHRRGRDVRRQRVVYDDTVIGDGCFIQDGAVLGKVPSLSRHQHRQARRAAAAGAGRRAAS